MTTQPRLEATPCPGRAGGIDPHVQQRFVRYRENGDRALRNELVELHRPLAAQVARGYTGRGEPLDDLVQVATLGLLKAVERYDPGRGVPFDAFARATVHGELKRHFRDRTWRVAVPRRAKERSLRIHDAVDVLSHRHGHAPTLAEIAAELGCALDDVLEAIEVGAAYRPISIDASGHDFQAGSMSRYASATDPGYEAYDDGDLARHLLHAIPHRERTICQLRFGEDLVQREIAERLGISQMQVSRLLSRSIDRMRQRAERSQP